MQKAFLILILTIFLASCEKNSEFNEILKFYGAGKEDIGYSIAITDDNYCIGGQLTQVVTNGTRITGSYRKVGLFRTGVDGCLTGSPSYFDTKLEGAGSKIIVLEDGSAVCAGHVIDSVTRQTDIFVVKVAADGEVLNKNTFKTPGNQTSSDIIKTTEGFMLLGSTNVERLPVTESTGNRAGRKDILLMRLNERLEQIDTIGAKGFPGDDYGVALKSDGQGGFIIAGTTDRTEPGKAKSNLYLIKVNAYGSETESAIVGGDADEYAADIEVMDDRFILTGTVKKNADDQYVCIAGIPFEINSAPLFVETIDPDNASWTVNAMCRYRNNFLAFAGQAGSKMLIFVTDYEGHLVPGWIKTSGGTGNQAAFDLGSDDEGNIIAVGKSSNETNSLLSLVKFRF